MWPFGVSALCLALLIVGAVAFIVVSLDFPDESRP
ncbi:hypothetical protein ACVWXN_000181 [Bradyrhizobium sp. i1.4.4]